MKPIQRLASLILFLASGVAVAGDEGTVIAIDGKGGFKVATMQNGMISFLASPDIMRGEPRLKFRDWPNVYWDLQVGDRIKIDWGREEKSGKVIATRLRVMRRGG